MLIVLIWTNDNRLYWGKSALQMRLDGASGNESAADCHCDENDIQT